MAIVILNHTVKDFHTWKSSYDADQKRREAAGLKEIYVAHSADAPGDVHIAFETNDVEKAKKMMEDPELHKVMEEAGVVVRPTIRILHRG
jgi:hypothetical protein